MISDNDFDNFVGEMKDYEDGDLYFSQSLSYDPLFTLTQPTDINSMNELNLEEKHHAWLKFLENFKSTEKYQKRVNNFFHWRSTLESKSDFIHDDLEAYFQMIIDLVDDEGKAIYCATCPRQMFSIFAKYYQMTGRGELKIILPVLYASFNHLESGYEESHAREFTKEDLLKLHALDDNNTTLFYKAYSAAAVAFASRSSETFKLNFWKTGAIPDEKHSFIQKLQDGSYRVDFLRNKNYGKQGRATYNLIIGTEECLALDNYISAFPEVPFKTKNGKMNGRTGRFWRYFNESGLATVKDMGIHTCEKVGVNIAKLLGMPNPESHTGQCWRGTTATLGADAGLNERQLQAVTGHKSSAPLLRYAANSAIQKRTAAQAFSISGSSIQDHNRGKENVDNKKSHTREITVKKGRGNFEIILNNSTVTNLKVVQGGSDHDEEEESEESDS